ncbi:hypothetical protein CWE12_09630 [Aliidiomarina sedimenti]|uniref:Lipoprotein n=1 Tax=Aliidiomarina sedimenti TaxID=1933879 RepID=A0ABY0BY87_9GAMM|nr:hypothetical protein [Aliidiomarina sedimenti]RUO29235.1 hypothetical protein CWE12_09630 [Aliidiomarina sedimenti]
MKLSVLIISLALLAGCASQPSAIFDINYGDTRASVVEKLGPPEDRQFKEDYEAFQYCTTGTSFGAITFNIIWLRNEVVTGMNNYTANHEGSCSGHFRQIS